MHAIGRIPWRAALCLGGIVGLAFAVRTYHLDFALLSFDETFSWGLGRFPPREIVQRTSADVHPPLYYVLLHSWVELLGAAFVSPRFLSALCGVACVPLAYVVCLEAAPPDADRAVVRRGALLVALLMALHVSQVELSRVLRMYSLGVLLAGSTTWLLLRALRSNRSGGWWFAYGVAVAAFAYTHYYALFSIAGQAVFVLGSLLWRWRADSFRAVRADLSGFLYAGLVALVLYGPWLPILRSQVGAVRQDYWIPALTWEAVGRALFLWTSGRPPAAPAEMAAWFAVFAGGVLFTLCRGGRVAWLFASCAGIAWLLAVGVSFVARSIFVERYLAFAQFPLLCLLSVTWRCLPGVPPQVVLGVVSVGAFGSGLADSMQLLPDRPNDIADAARFVGRHSRPGDVVFVDDACDVHLFGYYLARSGVGGITVQAPHAHARLDRLHFGSCLLSLSPADLYAAGERPGRYWTASCALPASRRAALQETFEGDKGSLLYVTLFE